jgi:hypothetical protein
MVNIAKFAFEAFLGIIFIVMAVTGVSVAIDEGQFTGLASTMILFVAPIIVAIYLYALAKNSGIMGGK